jgi:hypothetical protein
MTNDNIARILAAKAQLDAVIARLAQSAGAPGAEIDATLTDETVAYLGSITAILEDALPFGA